MQTHARDSVFAEAARKAAALTLASTLGAFCASNAAVASTGEPRNEAFSGQALESADAGSSASATDTGESSGGAGSSSEGAGSAGGDTSGAGTSGDTLSEGATGANAGGLVGGAGATGGSADSDNPANPADPANPANPADAADPVDPAADPEAFALASATDLDAATTIAAADAAADAASPDAQAATLYDRIQAELAASASAVVDVEAGDALDSQVAIPANKQLTLNLNGCSLSATAAGAAFQLGAGSTLTIIDNSAAKTGSLSTGSALAMQGDSDFEKCNLNLQSGHVSCSTLVSSANCMQVTLSGGSAAMTSTMRVTDSLWVDVRGACSVSSSAATGAFQINGGGSVSVLGNARVTYSGSGAVFVLKKGAVLEMGSGASCGVAISATSGSIVQFDSGSVDASFNGASISCGSGHPVFKAGSGGAGATIKFVNGVLPDDSLKNFLASGSFCVHEPGKGFVVRDQAFLNDSCIGVADDVYYYSEEDFANATGNKVHFLLVEFSFDPVTCAGTSLVGKTGHIHVAPGTQLRNAPLFELMEAPARDGYVFRWVRASTGDELTPDEVLALPIAAGGAYSFVGTYVAEQVQPPEPVTCDVVFRWGGAYVGDGGADAGDARMARCSVEKGKCLAAVSGAVVPSADEVAVEGYEFVGWFDGAGAQLDEGAPVEADAEYTARYEKAAGPVDPGPDVPDPGPDEPDPGPGPDEPDPPTPPDPGPDEPDPGPVGPVGPVDPGAGGSGAGGNGGAGSGTPTPPNPSGSVGPGAGGSGAGGSSGAGIGGGAAWGGGYGAVASAPGSRGPLDPHAPETPWNPPGLALAAGFTVPASGPGVLVRELMSAPGGTPAAGAGAGDGGSGGAGGGRDAADPWDALGAGARTFFDAQGPAGVDLPLSAAEVAVLVGLGAATALAALIASRRSAFLAANAASTA